jgi:hypothetical protein
MTCFGDSSTPAHEVLALAVDAPDGVQLPRPSDRQRLAHEGVEDGPDCGVGADAQRQRQHRGRGKTGTSPEPTKRVADVEPHRPEELLDSRYARIPTIDSECLGLIALAIAEFGKRLPASLIAAEPKAHEIVGAGVDVELELHVDVGSAIMPKHSSDAREAWHLSR